MADTPTWKLAGDCERLYFGEGTKYPNFKVIPKHLIFRIKRNSKWEPSWFTAHVVSNGYLQIPGKYFDEFYKPVSDFLTIRVALAYVGVMK